jgi:hypothetical protein
MLILIAPNVSLADLVVARGADFLPQDRDFAEKNYRIN